MTEISKHKMCIKYVNVTFMSKNYPTHESELLVNWTTYDSKKGGYDAEGRSFTPGP